MAFLRNLALGLLLSTSLCWTPQSYAQPQLGDQSLRSPAPPAEENPLKVQGLVTPFELEAGQSASLELKLTLPEGYKAYLDQFDLEPTFPIGLKISPFALEPIQEFYDDFSKQNRKGLVGEGMIRAQLELPASIEGDETLRFKLTYQACTKTYCLFPKHLAIEIPYKRKLAAVSASSSGGLANLSSSSFFEFSAEDISKRGLLLTFLIVFVAGFLTSLTPCVFPMIPITLAVLGREAHARSKWQQVIVSHVYILGIALTYAGLGLLAASTGALFGAFMNSPYVLGFVCLMFLAMAFSMFGYFDLEPPVWMREKLSQQKGQGLLGVFLTGAVSGIVASPCVGPVLVGILTFVAKTQDLVLGFSLLFVFALGMGQLFLLLGIFSQATRLLPRSGAWMENVKGLFGLLMLGAFFYFLRLMIPETTFGLVFGISCILLGIKGGAFKREQDRIRKGVCLALFVFGIYVLVENNKLKTQMQGAGQSDTNSPSAGAAISEASELQWQPYSAEIIAKAKTEGRPVLIDFYADWCAACKELEHKTFNQSLFIDAAKRFYLVRFDATGESTDLNLLREQFEIVGLPTVVFLDSQGQWVKEATVIAFQNAEFFKKRMDLIK